MLPRFFCPDIWKTLGAEIFRQDTHHTFFTYVTGCTALHQHLNSTLLLQIPKNLPHLIPQEQTIPTSPPLLPLVLPPLESPPSHPHPTRILVENLVFWDARTLSSMVKRFFYALEKCYALNDVAGWRWNV
jgi:hypothetical protein